MSQRPVTWVLGHTEVEGVLRLVLVVLASNSEVDGSGRMRRGRIAHQARIPIEHVDAALKALAARQEIELGEKNKSTGGTLTFGYRVMVPEDYSPHP